MQTKIRALVDPDPGGFVRLAVPYGVYSFDVGMGRTRDTFAIHHPGQHIARAVEAEQLGTLGPGVKAVNVVNRDTPFPGRNDYVIASVWTEAEEGESTQTPPPGPVPIDCVAAVGTRLPTCFFGVPGSKHKSVVVNPDELQDVAIVEVGDLRRLAFLQVDDFEIVAA